MHGVQNFPWKEWELLSATPQSPESKLFAAGLHVEDEVARQQEEHRQAVTMVSDKAARRVMKDATIEMVVHVKRALKGFNNEVKIFQAEIEKIGEARSADMSFLVERLQKLRSGR